MYNSKITNISLVRDAERKLGDVNLIPKEYFMSKGHNIRHAQEEDAMYHSLQMEDTSIRKYAVERGETKSSDRRVRNLIKNMHLASKIAQHRLKEQGEFTIDDIIEVNRAILKNSRPKYSGGIRSHNVRISGHDVVLPPSGVKVYSQLENALGAVNIMISREEILDASSLAHVSLAYVHPFEDGNGRACRIIANSILAYARLPPVVIKVSDREFYQVYMLKPALAAYREQASLPLKQMRFDDEAFKRFFDYCATKVINSMDDILERHPIGKKDEKKSKRKEKREMKK